MEQVMHDTTTVQPSTSMGLPEEDDKVVRELDVYLCSSELGSGAHTYLLQFPLRPPWRPYVADGDELHNVKLKHKVKKLQCEVPLDASSRNYNTNAEPSKQIKDAVLQSARLDMRTSFAAGFVEEDRLLLLPVDEALQLRPSLAHLDKEKEQSAAKKKSAAAAAEEEDAKPAEMLQQLTVQVKRRETEQQTEARLRSYAHLAAQEEADQWVPLDFYGANSELAQTIWDKLIGVQAADVAHTLSREQYLEAIVPGSNSLQGQGETASWAAGAMAAHDMGRPGASARAPQPQQQQQAEVSIPEELHAAITSATLTLLRGSQVVQLDTIRLTLLKCQDTALKSVAGGASDASLHAAVLASGEVTHLRKSYFATRLGNTTLDPLRNVVIELLREAEQLKRSDIMEAAKQRGIPVSDTLYSKVVKELCSSRGSIWSLK